MSRMIDADKLIKVLDEWLESAMEHERENVRELDDISSTYWKGQGRAIFNVMKVVKEDAKDKEESVAIWHNVAEEVPTEIGAEVIVACRNKNKECGIWLYDLIQCWEGEWKPRLNWETPIRWAYVRDLDSERKEK